MAAMDLDYDTGGLVSARTEAFYAERAKGGAGLIIVGGAVPTAGGILTPRMLRIDRDECIPGYRSLTDTLHRHGARVALQLLHAGRDAMPADGSEPIAPSAMTSRLTRRTPRPMTVEEIKETVEAFGQAAARAREAGFDAVELLASSGFLISQFMSPVTNKREDGYGGDLDHRLCFALEVIAAVRRLAGADFPLIVRHTGDDYIKGGHTQGEAKIVARRLAEASADAIDVQVGWEEAPVPTAYMVVPRGAFAYLAQGMKEVVNVPVIACNRINDPVTAERILEEGKADFVAMARALMADPYFPVKAAEGRFEDINTCVACNQGCLDNIFSSQPATCLVNPEVGREEELAIVPAEQPKRVVVVGGGPAGLEAARVLSLRGHRVTLFEKEQRLGGQLAVAVHNPAKREFSEFIRYLTTQVQKLGVDVRLGQEATAELILREQPEAVILAAGGQPRRPDLRGVDLPQVVTAQDVLDGKAAVGQRVVIVGARGTGCDTALFLAQQSATPPDAAVFLANWGALDAAGAIALTHKPRQITLVRRGERIGDDIGRTVRWIVMKELADHSVQTVTGVEYEEINERGVVVIKDGERRLLEADTVVLATGLTPRDGLAGALAGKVAAVHVVGDAREVRDALAAVAEAAVVARQV